jgi:hypothetical protein
MEVKYRNRITYWFQNQTFLIDTTVVKDQEVMIAGNDLCDILSFEIRVALNFES